MAALNDPRDLESSIRGYYADWDSYYEFNALPPMLGPRIDACLAREDPTDWRGYVMASCFMLTGRRM